MLASVQLLTKVPHSKAPTGSLLHGVNGAKSTQSVAVLHHRLVIWNVCHHIVICCHTCGTHIPVCCCCGAVLNIGCQSGHCV